MAELVKLLDTSQKVRQFAVLGDLLPVVTGNHLSIKTCPDDIEAHPGNWSAVQTHRLKYDQSGCGRPRNCAHSRSRCRKTRSPGWGGGLRAPTTIHWPPRIWCRLRPRPGPGQILIFSPGRPKIRHGRGL